MPQDAWPSLALQTKDFTGDMRNVVAVLNGEAGRGATVRSFQAARIDVSGGRAGFRLPTDWVRPHTLTVLYKVTFERARSFRRGASTSPAAPATGWAPQA